MDTLTHTRAAQATTPRSHGPVLVTEADFNVVLYPETASTAAQWLQRSFGQPFTRTVPIGAGATREFIAEVAALAGLDAAAVLQRETTRAHWYSRSVDSTYLTGKRVFVFGDATHAVAAARVASEELGFEVVGIGTYSREFAREIREVDMRASPYDLRSLHFDPIPIETPAGRSEFEQFQRQFSLRADALRTRLGELCQRLLARNEHGANL